MGDTWAVDLSKVGAIYPWLGWEVVMVVVAVLAWLIWHVVQIRQEEAKYTDSTRLYGKKEEISKAIDQYPY